MAEGEISSIGVKLTLDKTEYSKGMKEAGQEANAFNAEVEKVASGAKQMRAKEGRYGKGGKNLDVGVTLTVSDTQLRVLRSRVERALKNVPITFAAPGGGPGTGSLSPAAVALAAVTGSTMSQAERAAASTSDRLYGSRPRTASGWSQQRRAVGGPVQANRGYIVGDAGRAEVFVPKTPGLIEPSVQEFYRKQNVLRQKELQTIVAENRLEEQHQQRVATAMRGVRRAQTGLRGLSGQVWHTIAPRPRPFSEEWLRRDVSVRRLDWLDRPAWREEPFVSREHMAERRQFEGKPPVPGLIGDPFDYEAGGMTQKDFMRHLRTSYAVMDPRRTLMRKPSGRYYAESRQWDDEFARAVAETRLPKGDMPSMNEWVDLLKGRRNATGGYVRRAWRGATADAYRATIGMAGPVRNTQDLIRLAGATIDEQRGATMPARPGIPVPSSGYAVGIARELGTETEFAGIGDPVEFMQAVHKQRRAGSPYVGTWIPEGSDRIWVDPVTVTRQRQWADMIARAGGELAYYDLGRGREIPTSKKQLRASADRIRELIFRRRMAGGMVAGAQHGRRKAYFEPFTSKRGVTRPRFLSPSGKIISAEKFFRMPLSERKQTYLEKKAYERQMQSYEAMTEEDIAEAQAWYPLVHMTHQAISTLSGLPMERTIGAAATASPRVVFPGEHILSARLAPRIANMVARNPYPTREMLRSISEAQRQGMGVLAGNALRAAEVQAGQRLLQGRKISDYQGSILDADMLGQHGRLHGKPVPPWWTNDIWMNRLGQGKWEPSELGAEWWATWAGGRRAAMDIEQATGIVPFDLQAASWIQIRDRLGSRNLKSEALTGRMFADAARVLGREDVLKHWGRDLDTGLPIRRAMSGLAGRLSAARAEKTASRLEFPGPFGEELEELAKAKLGFTDAPEKAKWLTAAGNYVPLVGFPHRMASQWLLGFGSGREAQESAYRALMERDWVRIPQFTSRIAQFHTMRPFTEEQLARVTDDARKLMTQAGTVEWQDFAGGFKKLDAMGADIPDMLRQMNRIIRGEERPPAQSMLAQRLRERGFMAGGKVDTAGPVDILSSLARAATKSRGYKQMWNPDGSMRWPGSGAPTYLSKSVLWDEAPLPTDYDWESWPWPRHKVRKMQHGGYVDPLLESHRNYIGRRSFMEQLATQAMVPTWIRGNALWARHLLGRELRASGSPAGSEGGIERALRRLPEKSAFPAFTEEVDVHPAFYANAKGGHSYGLYRGPGALPTRLRHVDPEYWAWKQEEHGTDTWTSGFPREMQEWNSRFEGPYSRIVKADPKFFSRMQHGGHAYRPAFAAWEGRSAHDLDDIHSIAVEDLHRLQTPEMQRMMEWESRDYMRRLGLDLTRLGIKQPIDIRLDSMGKPYIYDGNHRIISALELDKGDTYLPARISSAGKALTPHSVGLPFIGLGGTKIRPRQAGGPGTLEGVYLVGEIGKELFVPDDLAHLIPKKVMDQIPKAKGGMQVIGTKRDHDLGGELFFPPSDGVIVPNRLMDQVPRAQGGAAGDWEGTEWGGEYVPGRRDFFRDRGAFAQSRAAGWRFGQPPGSGLLGTPKFYRGQEFDQSRANYYRGFTNINAAQDWGARSHVPPYEAPLGAYEQQQTSRFMQSHRPPPPGAVMGTGGGGGEVPVRVTNWPASLTARTGRSQAAPAMMGGYPPSSQAAPPPEPSRAPTGEGTTDPRTRFYRQARQAQADTRRLMGAYAFRPEQAAAGGGPAQAAGGGPRVSSSQEGSRFFEMMQQSLAEREVELYRAGAATGTRTPQGLVAMIAANFGGGLARQQAAVSAAREARTAMAKAIAPFEAGGGARFVGEGPAGTPTAIGGQDLLERYMAAQDELNLVRGEERDLVKQEIDVLEDAQPLLKDVGEAREKEAEAVRLSLPGTKEQAGNLLKVVGGIQIYSMAMQAIGLGMQAATPVAREMIDQLRGWRSASEAATTALSKQTDQAQGNTAAVLNQYVAAARMGGAMGDLVSQALELPTAVKAGAEAAKKQEDAIKAVLGLQGEGAPPGALGGYGGLFEGHVLGSPGALEAIAGAFSHLTMMNPQGPYVEWTNAPSGSRFVNPNLPRDARQLEVAAERGDTEAAAILAGGAGRVKKNEELFDAYLKNINDAAMRGSKKWADVIGNVTVTWREVSDEVVQEIEAADLPENIKNIARAANVVPFVDGRRVTELTGDLAGTVTAAGLSIMPAETWAKEAARQLSAQFKAADIMGQFQLDTMIPFQLSQQLIQQPLIEPSAGVSMLGADAATRRRARERFRATREGQEELGIIRRVKGPPEFEGDLGYRFGEGSIAGEGIREMRNLIMETYGEQATQPQMIGGEQIAAPLTTFDEATQKAMGLSKEIGNLTTEMLNAQRAAADVSYANQIRLAQRALGDALGMLGEAGGTRLGYLQREQWLTSRASQSLGLAAQRLGLASQKIGLISQKLSLDLQARQIATSLAVAQFQAPGETGEERFARQREAIIRAGIEKRQLGLSRQQFGISQDQFGISQQQLGLATKQFQIAGQIWAINAQRAAVDARKTIEVMQAARNAQLIAIANQKRIQEANREMGAYLQRAANVARRAENKKNQYTSALASGVLAVNESFLDLAKGINAALAELRGGGTADREAGKRDADTKRMGSGQTRDGGRPAVGYYGKVLGATEFTVGEAGSETVAILRNPRTSMLNTGGGSGPVSINISISGNTVRSDGDLENLASMVARKVERSLAQKGEMMGLRQPSY